MTDLDKAQEEFTDTFVDIVSSGYGFGEWQQEQLGELFAPMDKKILAEWLEAIYNQPYGVEEGVNGEELNWVAKYLGKTAQVVFV